MRFAIIVALVTILMIGSAYLIADFIYPFPAEVGEAYINNLVAENWAEVHLQHHSDTSPPSLVDFEDEFNDFSSEFGLTGIEIVEINAGEESVFEAEYKVKLAYLSEYFPTQEIELDLKLSREGIFDWKVHWQDHLPLPEYGLEADYSRIRLMPERGEITDRNGMTLAGGGSVVNIGVQPGRIEDPEQLHQILEEELGLSEEYVRGEYEAPGIQDQWFVPLTTVSERQFAELDPILRPIPGIFFRREESRVYQEGKIAGHITGYLGQVTAEMIEFYPDRDYQAGELVGRSGLELGQEVLLRGQPGYHFYIEIDGQRELFTEKEVAHGEDVQLTVDIPLQKIATEILKDEEAAFVLLDANSGEILVLASSPGYDPNEFIGGISSTRWNELSTDSTRPMFNRATQGRYAPGSTFKALTAAAALDLGIFTPTSQFNDSGELVVQGNSVRNFEEEVFGEHIFSEGIVKSINTTMAKVGLELGAEELSNYFSKFQLDQELNLGLPTQPGQIGNPGRSQVALAWTSIGQDQVLLTPLLMAELFSVLANGGYAPELDILTRDLTLQIDEAAQVVQEETVSDLDEMLRRVVTEGTGQQAEVSGLNIHGKTGTAEVGNQEPHAWFAGYIREFDERDLAFAMLVEEGGVGGRVAAPLVNQFFSRVLEEEVLSDLETIE
ncbi:MAG: peptidoglycan D,D-transpeptidase FtsI family protein [Bacillota bacterium]